MIFSLALFQLGLRINPPWFCFSVVFQLFSRSQDSSASYRAAKASVNPSSRYGKLGFRVWVVLNLFLGCLWSVWAYWMFVWINGYSWCVGYLAWWKGLEKWYLLQVNPGRDLVISLKRVGLAQASLAEAHPSLFFPRSPRRPTL